MPEHNAMQNRFTHLLLILLVSFGLGAVIQFILPMGVFWTGLWVTGLVIFLVGCTLYIAWHLAGAGKVLAWMMLIAFILRIAYGVFLAWGLPRFGYEETPQLAGYVYEDAYRRDRNAWTLSQSEKPITRAFSNDYEVDQYGGLLALSAFVYRTISPDAHRPVLIVILAAGAMALSLPFLMVGLNGRFNTRAARWAGWILVFYPEGVLLGSSQMREPFLILFFTMAFWAAANWMNCKNMATALAVFGFSALSLLLFSFRVGLPLIGVVLLWVWVIESAALKKTWLKIAGWMIILAAVLAGLWAMRYWVDAVLHWDTLQTISRSGMLQFQIERLPEWLQFPFLLIYGLLQPVLPAAIAAPAPWIWQSLGIFRALGWYLLFPLLAYALIRVWRLAPGIRRKWLLVFVLSAWIWVLIASARAGGDQWDNPRYRANFIPWMVIVAGWGLHFAKETQDRWLKRVFWVEGIFLAFFTQWYLSRYYRVIPGLDLGVMVVLIFVLSLAILIGSWLSDRKCRSNDLMHKG